MNNYYGQSSIKCLNILQKTPSGIFNICGEQGLGKNAIVEEYMYLAQKEGYKIFIFSQRSTCFEIESGYTSRQKLISWLNAITDFTNAKLLLILDAFFTVGYISEDIEDVLVKYHKAFPNTKIIITSLYQKSVNRDINFIKLNPLTNEESLIYIKKYNANLNSHLIKMVADYAKGNPYTIRTFINLLTSSQEADSIIYQNCIVDSSGKPITSKTKKDTAIKISEINDQLLYGLSQNPNLLYNLSSYDFERVIAKIFEKKGFSIKITPQTRDGGKDIFIAKNDLCSFLFYVECKKYAPNHPVGIEVIQRLYGVISAEKATGGIIVTTSYFAKPAKDYLQKFNLTHQITLQDYDVISNILKTL